MYKVLFYKDKNGKEPVYDYIKDLASKKAKSELNDFLQRSKENV